MTKQIYLDYAAATPMDAQVRREMEPYFSRQFQNPSATYLSALHGTKKVLEAARQNIAKRLGARPAEIVFTAGATEANNLAIQGLMRQYPDGEIITSTIEHPSVLEPAGLFKHRLAPVDSGGMVDLAKLEKLVNPKTVLVSIMLVNNELGTIQPVSEISKILNLLSNERLKTGNKTPLYLHTDAAQAGNYLDLHTSRLGADLMSINGGKIYGPKQSGVLYIKAGVKLQPLIVGGGQEFGLRAGTENVAACVGLAAALENSQSQRLDQSRYVQNLQQNFEKQIVTGCPRATLNGHPHRRAPHISSFTFPGLDNERLMMQLDEAGIQAAVGSACSASSDQPSHVLSAIGLTDEEAQASLRFSFGKHTTRGDIDRAAKVIIQLVNS